MYVFYMHSGIIFEAEKAQDQQSTAIRAKDRNGIKNVFLTSISFHLL